MKKVLALVLALSVTLIGSMTVSAADLGRGLDVAVVNDDGSVTSESSNVSFILPEAVAAGDTVTVTMTGSSDGDFRVWLIDTNETTNSNVYQMSVEGFTSGDFNKTFDLTATGEGNEIFFKAPTYDGAINNLVVTSLSVGDNALIEGAAVVEDAAVVEADATAVPKTGVNSNAGVYMAFMAVIGLGFVATKKKIASK